MKSSFLQLCHKYNPQKHFIHNWFLSEKLDGIRCLWDGGITRQLSASQVPWANVAKDYRFKEEQICSGLWTRYGHVIHAPDWFLDHLPKTPLDGELWLNHGSWQELSSIIKNHDKGPGWLKVKFIVFESPSLYIVFDDKEINETNYKKNFVNIIQWIQKKGYDKYLIQPMPFIFNYTRLKEANINNEYVRLHEQIEIPVRDSNKFIEEQLTKIVEKGGEGVILRNPVGRYECGRSHNILKHKPFEDDEGIVKGYFWGKETELGSKLLGLMGSLIVEYKGKQFQLSGFTDEERRMTFKASGNAADYVGEISPGELVTGDIHNPKFPRGNVITFRYRELSDRGVPKEAKYLRKFENV